MPRMSLADHSPVVSANPRWALERAVKAARIPAPAKLILFDLMTCLGPDSLDLGKWSPGMRRLTAETGLNNHTVVRYARLLEEHGWLSARKHKGRRTEYTLSAGRDFTDRASARKSNLPGVVSLSNTTVATTDNGGVVSGSNTFRTCPDQKSEQVQTVGQAPQIDDLDPLPGTGHSPASTPGDDQEVLSLVATVRAKPSPALAALLADIDL